MKNTFELVSDFSPTGDQPKAIKELAEGLNKQFPFQTLLGATGTGKTFTIANVIKEVNRPTLILSHNKTLAAQLYGEFKQFFPNNAVEYFVSYYDYYQPEAYLPSSNTYIEKDLSINDEIEKLRLSTTSQLLSGRRDIIVVSSVSCIYGMGNPQEFHENIIEIKTGQTISRNKLLHALVQSLYARTEADFDRGNFRVKGDTIDVFPAYADYALRIIFWDDEIESIESMDPISTERLESFEEVKIYPANIFVTTKKTLEGAMIQIQDDLTQHLSHLRFLEKNLEAKRLEDRVNYDLEMMRELGYCSGIENYSRYLDGRTAGERPFCLLDYFPDDYLTVIDESHVTLPQVKAMYGGDRSRKENLVDYGFRLPAALDNRPLKFEEFTQLSGQTIYVSATPAELELNNSEGIVVEQIIRPTGLLDPIIEIKPVTGQVDDLMEEIAIRTVKNERILVTTLTKRMAEELVKYMSKLRIKCRYIHSEVDTLERVEILRDLRLGLFDVLVGINLLREGLDLPEVSLVAILDADKEGFLRSERALTQTSGRAARHIDGRVIMYANKITESMRKTIEETNRRRKIQIQYNKDHNLVPTALIKTREGILKQASVTQFGKKNKQEDMAKIDAMLSPYTDDPVLENLNSDELKSMISQTEKLMRQASKDFDFIEAARLRDQMYLLQSKLKSA